MVDSHTIAFSGHCTGALIQHKHLVVRAVTVTKGRFEHVLRNPPILRVVSASWMGRNFAIITLKIAIKMHERKIALEQ